MLSDLFPPIPSHVFETGVNLFIKKWWCFKAFSQKHSRKSILHHHFFKIKRGGVRVTWTTIPPCTLAAIHTAMRKPTLHAAMTMHWPAALSALWLQAYILQTVWLELCSDSQLNCRTHWTRISAFLPDILFARLHVAFCFCETKFTLML